jgi:hypothetical protein
MRSGRSRLGFHGDNFVKVGHFIPTNRAPTDMWWPCLLEKPEFEISAANENQLIYGVTPWRNA